jgi:hypothetical protein
MSPDTSIRQKPGRKSTIAAHPQRGAIEAACAADISLRKVAERFQVGIMAVHRHWHSLPAQRRSALAADVAAEDDARWREVSAGLAAIARRHPDARADIADLTRRIWPSQFSMTVGERAHAA